MIKYIFSRWLKQTFSSSRKSGLPHRRQHQFKPVLQTMEDRIVPSYQVTNVSDSGAGSLRSELAAAAGAGGGTVTFAAGLSGSTINLTSGGLTVSSGVMVINNDPSTIRVDGGGSIQVFTISFGAVATIDGLTIQHSHTGGFGGGLYNQGDVTLNNDNFNSNSASFTGGAISNSASGVANINNCSFNNNHGGFGGAISVYSGSVSISGSTFSGNSSPDGGAIAAIFGSATIKNSNLSQNHATVGGAVFNENKVKLTGDTFSSNSASSGGGGLYNVGSARVTSSNFNFNHANTGGGIMAASGTLAISQ